MPGGTGGIGGPDGGIAGVGIAFGIGTVITGGGMTAGAACVTAAAGVGGASAKS